MATPALAGPVRTLHWVFKIAHREETLAFYTKFLGMRILRHEEFDEGCAASCNGPYGNKWSKTMIGYGPERDHFVLELTYNYGIRKYYAGNDFQSITLAHDAARAAVLSGSLGDKYKSSGPAAAAVEQDPNQEVHVLSPNGYKFYLVPEQGNITPNGDRFVKVSLGVSQLTRSLDYWHGLLGMDIISETQQAPATSALLSYGGSNATKLELIHLGVPINRKTAFGRIAFACPTEQLKPLQASAETAAASGPEHGKILTPYVELPTPGKATVCVVILQDPDDQEICFVGAEAFDELSAVDPNAEALIAEAIKADPSLQPKQQ